MMRHDDDSDVDALIDEERDIEAQYYEYLRNGGKSSSAVVGVLEEYYGLAARWVQDGPTVALRLVSGHERTVIAFVLQYDGATWCLQHQNFDDEKLQEDWREAQKAVEMHQGE
jgi:hypothetical protein